MYTVSGYSLAYGRIERTFDCANDAYLFAAEHAAAHNAAVFVYYDGRRLLRITSGR